MLELKNICYKKNNKFILNNINLNIDNNKLIAITGPNGSGKSTLAKIIMGLLKPTSGEIFFNGQNITELNINERANLGISYAFQTPIAFKGMTIKNLFKVIDEDVTFITIKNYLSMVGLCAKEYIDRDFDDTLSGGEKKRIEIAIILFKNGTLNIFDEPEAGIDLWSFDNLVKIFKNKKNNSTNLLISHQEKILKTADEIILLKNGEILKHENKTKILKELKKPCSKCKETNYE